VVGFLDGTLAVLLSAAFVLGLGHSFEPDHVVAVSTIVSQGRGLVRSVVTGSLWGLGHTMSLLVVGVLVMLLRLQFPATIAKVFDTLVGVMLVVLGLWTVLKVRRDRMHLHVHTHDGKAHSHLHSHRESLSHEHKHIPFSVGIVHGLAGSGALLILAMATMSSITEVLSFMAAFGGGLVLAMSLISSVLSLPTRIGGKLSATVGSLFPASAGVLSLALGILVVLGFA
jgi:ABC-type nickel/cobalt efflux system permease component RcnA